MIKFCKHVIRCVSVKLVLLWTRLRKFFIHSWYSSGFPLKIDIVIGGSNCFVKRIVSVCISVRGCNTWFLKNDQFAICFEFETFGWLIWGDEELFGTL